ncbi:hypothetical protein IQ274_22230 [Nostoc sp. LEGE 12447]|nr:hypothetical protein [Nostoc sp. LEGE 12447]MBE9000889.1 hypothetical protein [Nostoc sp. LEGE 12447]
MEDRLQEYQGFLRPYTEIPSDVATDARVLKLEFAPIGEVSGMRTSH